VKLTSKQEAFVREYLIDLNATQAAIRAGYSEKTARQTASENMTKPYILARIEELKGERAEKLNIDAEWVLKRLVDISDRCMQVKAVKEFDFKTKKLVETGEYQFDSMGANKSTELIGKHLGMFREKLDINAKMGVMIVDDIDD
jgi:phage terminase small subunit